MCVGLGVRVCRSKRGLSQTVSLEVSSDSCTGRGSQYYFYIDFYFCLVIFCICILVCFLPRNISMEEDVSCESPLKHLEADCRKSLIRFHAIGVLCWYNYEMVGKAPLGSFNGDVLSISLKNLVFPTPFQEASAKIAKAFGYFTSISAFQT